MSKLFRTIGGFLLMVTLALSMSVSASARARIDVDADASLTLTYVDEDDSTALSGADFRLYKVAKINETDHYTVTEAFQDYQVKLNAAESAGNWKDLADTLSAYAARDNIEPLKEGTTDGNGKLTFSGLSVGLYLVVSDPLKKEKYTYIPTSYLVSLPNLDENDRWVYNVTSNVKKEKKENDGGPQPPKITRSVVKVWKDDENKNRPESVTVQLLRNGEIYEEAVLSEENNWSHTWKDLSSGDNWQLTEKEVPDKYTVSVSLEGNTFTVTNTCTSHTCKKSTLAQTGQLNWPIPLLAGCGLALFAAGWALVFLERRKDA